MAALTSTVRRSSNAAARLLALCALLTALAAAWLSLAPAAADGHDSPQLILSLVEDSDNIVPPGSTFSLNAQIRYNAAAAPTRWAEILDGSHLRLSGQLDWDDRGVTGAAFRIPAQYLDSLPAQSLPLTPLDAAGAAYDTTTGAGSGVWPVAFDGRTLVARAGTTNGLLQIFDLSADPPAQVATIAGAADERLGGQAVTAEDAIAGRAVAVWDQDATTAWVFAGAPGANTNQGKLYIYEVSYGADGATVSASPTVLEVPMSEYTNRASTLWNAYYGSAVSISADGRTLAVGAREIHATGAVYVYTMPDGDDEDWSDLDYADGVKVTPFQMPAWGDGDAATAPFDHTSSNSGDAYNQCDAYCSAVYANWSSAFGASVELSADGSTLVVGAPRKRYPGTTAGGGFLTANFSQNAGGIWVFSAPDGGWSAAPDATAGKTVIAAQASAAAWDPEANYSPGPAKRVEQADAELIPGAYGTGRTAAAYFGEPVNVSADGDTIVATARRVGGQSMVYVFEQPDGGWADDNSADATITIGTSGDTTEGYWGTDVNYDGSRVLVDDPNYDTTAPALMDVGAVYLFERADGGWSGSLAVSAATLITAPTPQASGFFGASRYNNAGTQTVYAQTDHNGHATTAPKLWAAPGPDCSERTLEGATTTTCVVPLGNTSVTVPRGTPDGDFTISGQIALRFSDGTEATTPLATLAAKIGTVDELADVAFGFATDTKGTASTADDAPYPSVVAPGESTTLQLQLLNENGKASAKGAAVSVLLTTLRGALSARLGSASGEACTAGGGFSCEIANAATALTAANADQILLTVTHPGAAKAGATRIRAVVTNASGRTFEPQPIEVTFSGRAAALAITEGATALLGYDPAAAEDAPADGRNTTTLVVSASDAAGNRATVPSSGYSAKLTDPDGKSVALTGAGRRARVDWPLRVDDAADGDLALSGGNPQARLTVVAAAAAPLAVGEYTLELSAGSGAGKLSATQTFSVAGGAASVALSADPTGAVPQGDVLTVTAVVNDSSGGPVPDGTPVTFSEQSVGAGNAVLVLTSSGAQRTRNGQASATLRAVGPGSAYVEAEADGVKGLQSVTVTPPPPPPLEERVTSLAADAFAVWAGPGMTSASEFYGMLENVWRVRKWTGVEWASYGETDGLLNSGSVDYEISRGDILWLSAR